MEEEKKSFKEKRIRNITNLYYSKSEIQKALYDFSKNREISPRYFEGFGKRPDSFQYKGDIYELVKKGATSFHCSEELWKDPLKISTNMNKTQLDELRIGWDLLLDIDCKWFDYSKLAAKSIIEVLSDYKIKNIGVKYSGSKGFHIIVPWKAFPKEINGVKTSDLFPDLPRKVVEFIRFKSEKKLSDTLPEDFYSQFKNVKIKRGKKCRKCSEVADSYTLVDLYCDFCKISETRKTKEFDETKLSCPSCSGKLILENKREISECQKCNLNSKKNPENFSEGIEIDLYELMGLDIILVSPRHLFRMPYSLHEKTALASVVINQDKVSDFEIKDADPLKAKIKDFMPESIEGEAKELVVEALDWYKQNQISRGENTEKATGKYADYKPIKIDNLSEKNFPPCTQKILLGISDGKKRALFALINLFRSVGMGSQELEKKIYDWNKKNEVPLKEGYIKSQLSWSFRKKPIMPPNCREFYQGIGVCSPDNLCRSIKNPINYVVRKSFVRDKNNKKTSKDNFKNKV